MWKYSRRISLGLALFVLVGSAGYLLYMPHSPNECSFSRTEEQYTKCLFDLFSSRNVADIKAWFEAWGYRGETAIQGGFPKGYVAIGRLTEEDWYLNLRKKDWHINYHPKESNGVAQIPFGPNWYRLMTRLGYGTQTTVVFTSDDRLKEVQFFVSYL